MFFRPKNRIMTGAARLLAALFLLAQAFPWPASGKTDPGAVRAAAIAAPQALEVCPHHPEGCPRDCMCPKTKVEADGPDSGTLTGPALTRCASESRAAPPESAAIFIVPEPPAFRLPAPIQPAPLRPARQPLPGFRAAPDKIPIA